MTHTTAEESKRANIVQMGDPLGTIFSALWQEVAETHRIWGEYCELFGTNSTRVDLLNEAAPSFFKTVQDALWERVILHIARLTEAPAPAGKATLTIRRLPALADTNVSPRVQALVSAALQDSAFCRDWRNRHIAHRDLALATDSSARPLDAASRATVNKALRSIADVLNLISSHYTESETAFDKNIGIGGAEELIFILDSGVKRKKDRKERISTSTYTVDDLTPRYL